MAVDLPGEVVELVAGGGFTCALLADRTVSCWGDNRWGELGSASAQGVAVVSVPPARSIGGGFAHACAVTLEGTVWCWGQNAFKQAGVTTQGHSVVPTEVPALADVVQVAGGRAHTCALRRAGRVTCWGSNEDGQLGCPDRLAQRCDVPVRDASSIAASDHYSCVVARDRMLCWGKRFDNSAGLHSHSGSPEVSEMRIPLCL